MRIQINDVQTMYADRRVVLRYAIFDDAGAQISRFDAVMDMPFADGITQAQAQAYVEAHVATVAPQADPAKPDAVTDALLALGDANAKLAAAQAQAETLGRQIAEKQAIAAALQAQAAAAQGELAQIEAQKVAALAATVAAPAAETVPATPPTE